MHPLTDLDVARGTVAIHWFEQSTFALRDSSGTVVQIDPYFPRESPPEQFIHAKAPLDESRLHTDAVLLHMLMETTLVPSPYCVFTRTSKM